MTELLSEPVPSSPESSSPQPVSPRRAPRHLGRSLAMTAIPPIVFGGLVLGLWYFITYAVLAPKRRFLLPPPHQVLSEGFFNWENLSEVLGGMWSSTRVALIGLVISIGLGMFIAVVMSQARVVERAMFPYMVVLQAIPILALVPMIAFWFGTGQTSRIIVCVLISLFPIIVNTLFGLQSADRGMHDLFTLQHAGRMTRLRKLMFPAAMPAIFAGLRISAGLSVIGAVVGDFFFGRGDVGIGQLLKKYANNLWSEQLFAAVIVTAALGVSVFLFFGWLQGKVVGRWYTSETP